MTKAVLVSVTSMIPTGGNLSDALRFYTEQMGFSVLWEAGEMAGIGRGAVSFNLVVNNNREWAENASFSIGVSDLDALYEEYRGVVAQVGPLELRHGGDESFTWLFPQGSVSSSTSKRRVDDIWFNLTHFPKSLACGGRVVWGIQDRWDF